MIFVPGDSKVGMDNSEEAEMKDVSDRKVVLLVCGSVFALSAVLLIGCVLIKKALAFQYPWVRPRPGRMI